MDFTNDHITNIISILYQCKLIARKDIPTFCPIRRNIRRQIRREGETNNISYADWPHGQSEYQSQIVVF